MQSDERLREVAFDGGLVAAWHDHEIRSLEKRAIRFYTGAMFRLDVVLPGSRVQSDLQIHSDSFV